ncbi:hypothetical protein ACWDO7_25535 [Streptomyces sp. NPDC003656]|uniref:hypothetical protein n=1 Tax=Streptomyces sp. DSM 110735 TaxID=2775031 RepID=UPI0018F6A86D|nr:hypothetical protein [Streptomyces sp. DSM 110735]MBJ7904247.1 hypothetical protein [Streptomyces sp. DSM 110735]
MSRCTTARSVLALLAAALLALQLFAPTGTFASAHTLGETQANDAPGIALALKATTASDAEILREPGRSRMPHTAPHTRDKRRGAASGDGPERPLIIRRAAVPAPPVAGSPHPRVPRSSGVRSPAVLQVFRC